MEKAGRWLITERPGRMRIKTAQRVIGARNRDVAVASDGAIWVITDETDGRLVRLSAAA